MELEIRPYQPSDLNDLYRICLLTADSGKDATHLFSDPELVGHFSAAPYVVFEPELCFVVVCSGKLEGYILGTKDSEKFYQRCEKEWFPSLRKKYIMPLDDDNSHQTRIIRLIQTGLVLKNDLIEYPAHLHIDLLPETQGQGMGRKLMNTFIDKLRELGVPALHLEVSKTNEGAIKFYQRMDFHIIKEYEKSIAFGLKL